MDGRGRGGGGGSTWLDDVGELLADRHHKYLFPKLICLRLRDAESPCSAFHVAGILPNGLDAPFEEVDGIFELQSV